MQKADVKNKEDGFMVKNWKDKRVIRFTTTHVPALNVCATSKRNRTNEAVLTPEGFILYYKYQAGIDVSDQLLSYFIVLRRLMV